METEKKAIQKQNGMYSIDGKRYMPFGKGAAYVLLIGGIGTGGLLLSGRENEQLRQENEQFMEGAAQNRLELTCDELAARGLKVRGTDGNMHYVICDEYGTPALQERGE